ncbi:MAG TPA: hypothetical protein VGN64_09585, partial [Dyadobacter sp.]|nr:hypothetical protein [Dyadobacter sp.]
TSKYSKMRILVFGATGSQQFHAIAEANEKSAEVIAATTTENSFDKLKQAGAEPVLADMAMLLECWKLPKISTQLRL